MVRGYVRSVAALPSPPAIRVTGRGRPRATPASTNAPLTVIAVYMLARPPSLIVKANPRLGPLPRTNKTKAASNLGPATHAGRTAASTRGRAQRGADGGVHDDPGGEGERAAGQQHGEGPRGGQVGKPATDLPAAAADRRADDRRGDDLVIQHDGEVLPDVRRGKLLERLGARPFELEVDDRLPGILVEPRLRIGEVGAGQDDLLFQRYGLGVRRGQPYRLAIRGPARMLRHRRVACVHELEQRCLADA